ncbi:hypothetical protein D3C78_1353100 [compost metagenome]
MAGNGISPTRMSPAHQIAAINATISMATSVCRLALELAPREPTHQTIASVPSSANSSCSSCQPNSAWPKPVAICRAAGKPTGITDRKSQPVTRSRRGPNAMPTKCATPPALGKWRPRIAKTMAIGKTRAINTGHAHRLLFPATSAASAGTANTPVPNKEVESKPTPCASPNSCFSPLIELVLPLPKEKRW